MICLAVYAHNVKACQQRRHLWNVRTSPIRSWRYIWKPFGSGHDKHPLQSNYPGKIIFNQTLLLESIQKIYNDILFLCN